MFKLIGKQRGFTLVELVIVIVVIGILAAVAIPKFLSLRKDAEQGAVESTIGALESAMSIYCSKQYLAGTQIAVHNPFDDLSSAPPRYVGPQDPVTVANTPSGSWTYRTSGSWVMYHPKSPITGGWANGGKRYIIYQVQPVLDGTDTVGLHLSTTGSYSYTWN
jgi:prepilin-type N-terminal cleavage/methylation domain-containing protein